MKKRKTILIAEDEKILSDMYKKKFEMSGFKVIQAFNGEEALGMAMKEKPDLIILDIIMPKLHGLDVMAGLQKDEWGKKAKIMVLTNVPDYPGFTNMANKWSYVVMSKADFTPEQIMDSAKKIIKN